MRGTAVPAASTSADRVNRAGLALAGLVLVGLGGYGLARGSGVLGPGPGSDPILPDSWRDFVSRNQDWFWPLAAGLAVLVAVVGLVWLRAQLAAAKPSAIDLTHREDGGRTTVSPTGAAQALAGDVEQFRGVQRASARLSGESAAPEVDLRVEVDDDCKLEALLHRIDTDALPRFRQALELDTVDLNVEFRLVAPGARQLR